MIKKSNYQELGLSAQLIQGVELDRRNCPTGLPLHLACGTGLVTSYYMRVTFFFVFFLTNNLKIFLGNRIY
jgi:hypothetical protein